jgi:uncharacterized Zn finger protein (UPF0148 family)
MPMKFCSTCNCDHPLTEEFWYKLHNCPQCKAHVKQVNAKYREENKDKIQTRMKEYYEKNKDERNKYSKKYSETQRKKRSETLLKYYERNKDIIKRKRKERFKRDTVFKIKHNLRGRFYKAFRCKYKAGSAVRDLECSVEELLLHLESKFTSEMNWENYGTYWVVDHIRPLCSFDLTDREQLLQACNYTNLQPLEAKENLRKGGKFNA